jgi:hypothetical protein
MVLSVKDIDDKTIKKIDMIAMTLKQFQTASIRISRQREEIPIYPRTFRSLWVFHQVPDFFLHGWTASVEHVNVALLQNVLFFADLFEYDLLALMVLLQTARFQVELLDLPVGQVILKRQNARVFDQMQLARPVEVQHGAERARVSVKKIFSLIVVVAQLEYLIECRRGLQLSKARMRQTVQCAPKDFVAHATDIQDRPSAFILKRAVVVGLRRLFLPRIVVVVLDCFKGNRHHFFDA